MEYLYPTPMSFSQLKEKMDVSETTLWRYLEELKEKEIIKKTIIDGNIKWKLNFDNKTKNTLNQFLED